MRLVKTKILFSLASELEFWRLSEGYEYKAYRFLYFRLSEFAPGSVRDAVHRLGESGAIDEIIRGKKALFRLTSLGRELLLRQLKLNLVSSRGWDGLWRLVILNKVGKKQRRIVFNLKKLEYQRVARGVYLTPFMVTKETKELILTNNWQNELNFIESRKLVIGDEQQWVRSLWPVDELAQKYADFVNLADRLLKLSRKNISLLQQAKSGFKAVFDRYLSLELANPRLPKRLLPPDWQEVTARDLFLRLAILAKTANL